MAETQIGASVLSIIAGLLVIGSGVSHWVATLFGIAFIIGGVAGFASFVQNA